jgi:hypothetical protein
MNPNGWLEVYSMKGPQRENQLALSSVRLRSCLKTPGAPKDAELESSVNPKRERAGRPCPLPDSKAPKRGHILCDMAAFRRVEDRQLEN